MSLHIFIRKKSTLLHPNQAKIRLFWSSFARLWLRSSMASTQDITVLSPLSQMTTFLVTSLTSSQTQYQCRTDDRWPEFLYVVNDTCLRCPSTCETCLPETANLHYPCRTCFIGYGFEPSPTARELLDSSSK